MEEYESDWDDSDNDVDIELEELVICEPMMTSKVRKTSQGLDKVWCRLRRAQNGKPGDTKLLKPYDAYRIVAIYKQANTYN